MTTPELENEFAPYDASTPEFSLMGRETFGRVVLNYDADTLQVIMPLGTDYFRFSVRLAGIDTPEMKSRKKEAKTIARRARDRTFELCTGQQLAPSTSDKDETNKKKYIKKYLQENICLVWLKCYEQDKFGRVLADIKKLPTDSQTFSEILLQDNLAYKYGGATKMSEEQQVAALGDN
jgi:endonuclease YncB( thermonuclease family)